jgi:hypothetical protein
MEASGDGNRDNSVVVRPKDGSELTYALGIGAGGLADVERAVDAQHVATFDGGWCGDVGEFAKWSKRLRQRLGFGLAGFCAEREDHGEFVEDDGRVFDEHGIGKLRLGGHRVDVYAELREEAFVSGVLLLGFREVDGLAFDEGELALGESGTYCASYGG